MIYRLLNVRRAGAKSSEAPTAAVSRIWATP